MKGLTRLASLAAGAALLAGAAAARAADEPAARPPNILFILADDYGIPGVGCYGGAYKTPHLDALAQSGIRFERCFSMPLCAPTRAACMTGRYGFRTGVVDNGTGDRATPQRETCVAKVMKQAGYATAVAGKWRQLSYFETKEDARAWGFDEFLIWGVGNAGEKGDRYWDPAYNRNGTFLTDAKEKFGPDLLHAFVVDFIGRHRDEPFFLDYPTVLIHGPLARTPDTAAGAGKRDLYAENVAYLDKQVGMLMAELERQGLRESTLVVFVGDNGSVKGGSGTLGGRPVDGHKGTMQEGGSRVPLIASWKETTPAGKVCADLVDVTDLLPTFAEVAGAKTPAGVTSDGRSFAPQLRGQSGTPREWVYVQLGDRRYVRSAAWKLDGAGQLFDMKEAPFREIPVAADGGGEEAKAARASLQAALDGLREGGAGAGDASGAKRKAKRKGAP